MATGKDRIAVLDFLRGIAALAVALHHFAAPLDPGMLKSAAFYGQLGVEVFFVISGFVIPYSLYRGGYTIRDYGTFVLKRVTRLDPPYLVTIVIIIALGVLSWYVPFQKDLVFQVSLPQVLLHFAYINVFFGYPWLNDVFWTLAIEFQYYLLIGLVFPLVLSRNRYIRIGSMAALGATAFLITSGAFVFYFVFLFLMGIITCQYWFKMIGRVEYGILLTIAIAFAFKTLGFSQTLAGCFAVLFILSFEMNYVVFRFLGSISYSLYLMHSPIGRRALNLLIRVTGVQSQPGKIVMIVIATGISIFAAYLLFRFVEKPSRRWSASFRYRKKATKEALPAPAEDLQPEKLSPAFQVEA